MIQLIHLVQIVRPADHLPVVLEVEDGGKEEDEQDRAEPGPLALCHHAAGDALVFASLEPPHAGLADHRPCPLLSSWRHIGVQPLTYICTALYTATLNCLVHIYI